MDRGRVRAPWQHHVGREGRLELRGVVGQRVEQAAGLGGRAAVPRRLDLYGAAAGDAGGWSRGHDFDLFWGSKSENGAAPFHPALNGGDFDHGRIMGLV